PGGSPLVDTLDQVLGVGDDHQPHPASLGRHQAQRGDGTLEGHPVVGGGGRVQEKVATLHAAPQPELHQPARPAGIVAGASVAKAGFIEVNRGNGKGRAQESSTWKCSRSSSTKVISSPVIDR